MKEKKIKTYFTHNNTKKQICDALISNRTSHHNGQNKNKSICLRRYLYVIYSVL